MDYTKLVEALEAGYCSLEVRFKAANALKSLQRDNATQKERIAELEAQLPPNVCGFDRNASHSAGTYVCNCGCHCNDEEAQPAQSVPDVDTIKSALQTAFNLGQEFNSRCNSEILARHMKAEEPRNQFEALSRDTCAALTAAPTPAAPIVKEPK